MRNPDCPVCNGFDGEHEGEHYLPDRFLPDALTIDLKRNEGDVWTAQIREIPAAISEGYGVLGACQHVTEALFDVMADRMGI